jgi:hypothetical protein
MSAFILGRMRTDLKVNETSENALSIYLSTIFTENQLFITALTLMLHHMSGHAASLNHPISPDDSSNNCLAFMYFLRFWHILKRKR